MELKIIGSSSSGNCYVFENDDEALILEAGIRLSEIKKALNFQLKKVVGCLITHQHNDHAKYLKNIIECGIHTIALKEVFESKNIVSSKAVNIELGKGYMLGGFKVIPFTAAHDVPCVGFIIEHEEIGRLLFLTDSYMLEYSIKDLNHVMIECNYSDKKLCDNIEKGITMPFQRSRLLRSHMEINTCKAILRSNDLSKVENIILIHLSKDNGDEYYFVSEIERLTGKLVFAAKPDRKSVV